MGEPGPEPGFLGELDLDRFYRDQPAAVDRPRYRCPMAPVPSRPSWANGLMRSGSHRRSGANTGGGTLFGFPLRGPDDYDAYFGGYEGPGFRGCAITGTEQIPRW